MGIVVVATGGTISMRPDPVTGGLVPALSGSDLVELLRWPEAPPLELDEFAHVPSWDMHGELAFRLALRVRESPGHLTTTIVPEESTFFDGTANWQIEALGDGHTRISVSARQTPRFWIPPVLGPLLLKRVFMKEVAETCANIERIVSADAHGG